MLRIRLLQCGLFTLVSIFPSPTSLGGQDIAGDPVSCPDCRIEMEVVGQFGLEEGSHLIRHPASATVDTRGRLWVVVGEGTPLLFGPDGSFIQAVGRRGAGPGEYRYPSVVATVGDSVVVYDRAGYLTLLAPDLSAVRTSRLAIQPTALVPVRWPESVMAAAIDRDPERAGWPLHLLDLSRSFGQIEQSFGLDKGVYVPGSSARLARALTRTSTGRNGVWSGDRYDYRLARWDDEGELEASFRVGSPWAADGDRTLVGGVDTPPAVAIRSIHQAEDGKIWVVGWVPAEGWKEAWQEALRSAGLDAWPDGEMLASLLPPPHHLYDTILEVVDVGAGEVVVRKRLESGLDVTHILPDGRLLVGRENEVGVPYVEIVDPVVVGPS